ncbi:response regulator [Acaryochloris sp. 'Moss Beach']|uniref:response regulator transcription factor n=1 Tax=Acaryochloris TaxID=155977 RepID=UPI001BAF28A5|nr:MULTISPECIES: response regulator [Acaryochloris]QUY44001.1 response regulator [Acaryochloris marina S15]UJB68758.1 response regulator [Acaryochloris sp. 'Moss Beach']
MAKILVIEDEELVRANIAELLDAEEHDVVTAENGFLGALWAQEHLPELIICDVMMPELNGYEVLETLSENSDTAMIPFIFLTAMADKTEIRQGMTSGADDYLTKPFSRAELLEAVNTRLAKREIVQSKYKRERERAEDLQERISKIQENTEGKDNVIEQLQQDLEKSIPKLNLAIQMLSKLEPGARRDCCLQILKEACNDEISLLNQIPDVENVLTPEGSALYQELEVVESTI